MIDTLPAAWLTAKPSMILRHERGCCEAAFGWIAARDEALTEDSTVPLPSWLRLHATWGPTKWPLYWCQVTRAHRWDCGVFAAVADALLQRRRVDCRRVQAIETATESDEQQWSAKWRDAGLEPDWIGRGFVYHELVGVISNSKLRLWDPTEGIWIERLNEVAQAPLRAVRLEPKTAEPGLSRTEWDGLLLLDGTWTWLGQD